jgi:molybdopterin/thiamine biosynthesis adenylyltransferase
MNEIRIPENIWDRVYQHMFGTSGEHFAFLFVEVSEVENNTVLLTKDVMLISEDDTEISGFSLQMKLEAILKVTNTAHKKKLALIEIHNHGSGFGRDVNFSDTDRKGFEEFVPYVLDVVPGKPYAALVITKEPLVEGMIWNTQNKAEPISYVKIIGKKFRKLLTTSGKKYHKKTENKIFSRQVLAFGKEGQDNIQSVKVAIIGVGGIGSHVAQQLAYKGVRDFVLVDPDLVENTNLNRLIGATPNDVGDQKVKVAGRMISKLTDNKAKILLLNSNLRNPQVFDALKQVDFIFGCVDNDGARLLLNQFAYSYLIHYIDCATGINISNSVVEEAGGRVIVLEPQSPCLLCAKMIDLKEASDNLLPKEEYENKKKLGYIQGADIPDASVVSLNGVIASLGVVEFMMLVTGLRDVKTLTMYDMLAGREHAIVPCSAKLDENCLHHSFIGMGDKMQLERYYTNEVILGK